MRMYDTIVLDKDARVGYTKDGYLKAFPRICRTDIQMYNADECGIADADKVIRVYRPEKEVFSDSAIHSYTHLPVTLDHPPESVTPDTWKKYAVGETGDEVLRDGGSIRVPMMLRDAAAIKSYKEGTNQLSVGYECDLDWTAGKTTDGDSYDAVQRGIKANHLAVVAAARGGSALRIGDDNVGHNERRNPMTDAATINLPTMRTVLIDSIEVKMPDTAAQVVQRTITDLEGKLTDARKKIKELEEEGEEDDEMSDAKDAQLKQKDAQLKAKDAEIVKGVDALKIKDAETATLQQQLKDAELTPQKLDAYVRERIDVIAKGREVLGDRLQIDGKSVFDMRRAVVDSRMGEQSKDWDDKQITAAFATIQNQRVHGGGRDSRVSTFNDVTTSFGRPGTGYMSAQDVRDAAHADYVKDLENAWKGPQHKSA